MSAATPYVPETDFSAEFPGDQGNALDGEFVDIRRTFDELIANLGLIQRDDGRLRNQSVHPDALSSATLLLMASDWTPRGLWATLTLYAVGDVVEQAGASYVCVTEHIAGTFTTDRTSGYWIFLTNTADGTIYFDEATGTANAIVTDVALPALSDGLRLRVRALLANTSATVTVQTAAGTLNLKRLGGQALLVGDIVGAGHVLDLVYRASDTTWELLNPGRIDAALALTTNGAGASLVGIEDAGGLFTADDVEAALAEIATALNVEEAALLAHLADVGDAHDASAISYNGGTGMSATDVEAAIDELATEKLNASVFPNVNGNVTSTDEELNILDGVTATAAELNILAGATATTTEVNGLDMSAKVEYRDDFVTTATMNSFSGTDPQVVVGLPASTSGLNGVFQITTGDDAAASMAVNGAQGHQFLAWRADAGGLFAEFRVKLSAITNIAVFVGLSDQVSALEMPFTLGGSDALTSNAADAVGVLFDTAADTDRWWLVGVANNVDATKQDSAVAPVAGTYETWRIELSAAGAATFYRNGVAVGTAMASAVTPTVLLTPYIAAFSRGAASRVIDLDYVHVQASRV